MQTRPGGRLRRRLHDDSGLGLVEVLIAMVITGVVFSALAQTLIGSFRSVAVSEQRLRATQIASEMVEDVQALEWDQIGFYDSQVSPPVVVDGTTGWTHVSLGSTAPTPLPPQQPLPEQTVVRDGVSYDIDLAIVWDDPTPSPQMVRKRLQVTVTWDARGGTRSVTASSYVALPGSSAQPAFFYMLLASAGAPYQLIDDSGVPTSGLGVPVPVLFAVETNRPAGTVSVAWTDRGGSGDSIPNFTDELDGLVWSATEWGTTFVNGPTTFTFTASASGFASDNQDKQVTFLHHNVVPVATPSRVSGFTAQDEICLRTLTQRTYNTLVFRVEVQGFLDSDTAFLGNGVLTWPGVTTGTPTTRGVVQDITVPAGTPIVSALNQATFSLTVARTSALPTAPNVSTFTVPVKFASTSGGC